MACIMYFKAGIVQTVNANIKQGFNQLYETGIELKGLITFQENNCRLPQNSLVTRLMAGGLLAFPYVTLHLSDVYDQLFLPHIFSTRRWRVTLLVTNIHSKL